MLEPNTTPADNADTSAVDEQEQTTQVLQLVYASAARHSFGDEELVELLQIARRNNEALEVTGMLLYHEGSFVQVLEGEAETVERLYDKIASDGRHADTVLLFKGVSDHRNFSGWTMGFERLQRDAHNEVPGLSRFLNNGVLGLRADDGESIRRALVGFREGKYHRG